MKIDRPTICAVLVGIVLIFGTASMLVLALSVHPKPADKPAKIQPVIVVRSV